MKKAVLIFLLFLTGNIYAGELEELIQFALKNNPKLKSYDNLVKSFQHRAEFSTALPNPQIAFAINNIDTEDWFPTKKNPMSSFGLYISQKYDLPTKRERSSLIFQQRSKEVEKQRIKYQKMLIRDLKILYWEFSYSFEMERILKDIEKEIASLMEITEEKSR